MPPLNSALFLDRDGVINRKVSGDYVRRLSQFEWLPGALEAMVALGKIFRYVIIVTNQQGIGKGLMTAADVLEIHHHITQCVQAAGGHLDGIYCCPSLAREHDPNRKPGTGMAWQARRDFPDIDFGRSLMVGDSPSDMLFAEGLGMKCIFITQGDVLQAKAVPANVSAVCRSLACVPGLLSAVCGISQERTAHDFYTLHAPFSIIHF